MKLRKFEILVDSMVNNPWRLEGLYLNDINLIVGKNTSGKSRMITQLNAIAMLIESKIRPLTSSTGRVLVNIELGLNENDSLQYSISFNENGVQSERLLENGEIKLEREKGFVGIFSNNTNTFIPIDPPADKLVLSVRRDRTEFPYLEPIIYWAENVHVLKFGVFGEENKDEFKDNQQIKNLKHAPYYFDKLNGNSRAEVQEMFNRMGYNIDSVRIDPDFQDKRFLVKEYGLDEELRQGLLSQGMIRAISLLVILQFLIQERKECTIILDDIGEGLDYERSSKLAKIILEKLKDNPQIQFITTSNDSFLMDNFDIEYWNILKREGGLVKAYNYSNSKEKFDNFHFTGLSNFDLFSSNYLEIQK